jgi:hypothetical protein
MSKTKITITTINHLNVRTINEILANCHKNKNMKILQFAIMHFLSEVMAEEERNQKKFIHSRYRKCYYKMLSIAEQ